MLPRRPITRKYRPRLESLESRQLLSGVAATHGAEAIMPVTRPMSPHTEHMPICPCGTGKGIRIITS